ncbi:15022_t:CDS:2 [Entrophospora sp. SA101]|nr:15022_t:CDS:2 [Entrophospora sp. SA101]
MDEDARKKYCHLLMFDVVEEEDQRKKNSSSFDLPIENSFLIYNNNHHHHANDGENIQQININSSSLSPTKLLKSKRKKRSNKPKRTPRPPNAFILYRREKQSEVTAKNDKLTNADVSKVISKMWWKESEQERFRWEKTADRMKLLHMQEYPDYVYKPKKSINKKRKKIIHQKINNNAESTFADKTKCECVSSALKNE